METCPRCFGVRTPSDKGSCNFHSPEAHALNVACGWAFDAGMREAERDDARAAIEDLKEIAEVLGDAAETLEQEHAAALPAAVAAERERWRSDLALLVGRAPSYGDSRQPIVVSFCLELERIIKRNTSGAPAPREG